MGVKLTGLLPKKELSFDDLKNKRIVVDFSNSIYQFISSIRQPDGTPLMDSQGRVTSHLMGIWTRFMNLIRKDVKLIIVLDGKAPILKIKEQEERAFRKEIAKEKFQQAKDEEDIEGMAKYAKQNLRVSKEMINESRELMEAMGLPVIQAPSEADAQMSFIVERGDAWAAATTDVDPLLHGCPRLVTNLTLSQKRRLPSGKVVNITPELIELKEVLSNLGLNQDQLIALSILVGTDYNEGIERVGPKTALKLVKQHHDFETLFKEVKADFNWKQIYAVFKSMPIMKNYQLKWNELDVDKVKKILVDRHDFSEERVDSNLRKTEKKIDKAQKGLGDFF
ncbi:MAG TPA: flap endonuclease-1 [Candidatus Nanoarchaeia archaeon]|nr:flap endonuclease-1 [Candidatus Nanoarchaeia archaeon]